MRVGGILVCPHCGPDGCVSCSEEKACELHTVKDGHEKSQFHK